MEPKVYRDPERGRLLVIAIAVALLVLGAIVAGVLSLHRTSQSGGFTGKIVGKEFHPQPSREITVGQAGLRANDVAGDYILQVQSPDGTRTFNVWVDQKAYEGAKVGDDYYVIPSP